MKDDMKIEMEAGRNIQLDHIKEIMKENIPALIQQNQNLQSELDKIIRENRKLVKVLKKYADEKNWIENDRHTGFITNSITGDKLYDEDYARIILESIGEL